MPSGAQARIEANLAALRTLEDLQDSGAPATPAQQNTLGAWSSWGAAGVAEVFDDSRPQHAQRRAELRELLGEEGYAAARRTTINAHYTDPAYVEAMWAHLQAVGFTGGEVLEPGSGSGNFMVRAPQGARLTGVELDPTTAQISRHLVPDVTVRTESFADSRLPRTFDAAIGNVPFANIKLHDPTDNTGGHTMHNHFIIKTLNHLKPGGTAALLTSAFTMDQQNPAARREMHELADLVGAVRLPTAAHQRTAGTEVVTDLLLFRRRTEPAPEGDFAWERSTAQDIEGGTLRINDYFTAHPENVLGTPALGHGAHGRESLIVRPGADTVAEMNTALAGIQTHAVQEGLTHAPVDVAADTGPVAAVPSTGRQWDGHITALNDGTFTIVTDGVPVPLEVPASQATELRALLELRDRARELLEAEAATREDTPDLEAQREGLRLTWEDYNATYGPMNRFTQSERLNPATGETITTRRTPRVMATFSRDPFAPLAKALENFSNDEGVQTATPARLLYERQVTRREPPRGADTPEDALTISLDVTGGVDLDYIAELTGSDVASVIEDLGERIFQDPADDSWHTRADYLSGNVIAKLDAAQEAAETDPRWARNVEALAAVVPDPLGPEDIAARIGASWIPAAGHEQFLREITREPNVRVESAMGNWSVRGGNRSIASTAEWGTERVPAGKILKTLAEQRAIMVFDQIGDERVYNPAETEAAREKAEALQEKFSEWVWEDPARTTRLTHTYNRTFNNTVLRDYTAEGKALTLPGLAQTLTPREHQRTAVARMIHEPSVGLFHEVGAGKTLEMTMGVMELKRLGLVNKPAVVVPNHMLEQFSREWLQAYPNARILAAGSEDLSGDKRRNFVARAATNDWDAVILTYGAFGKLGLSPAAQADYRERELASQRRALEGLDGESATVKSIEKRILAAEEKLKEQSAKLRHDDGLHFEQTGIDYLVVDELHNYKNLVTNSAIQGASIDYTQKTTDLHMKLDWLRQERGGAHVFTGATATPIANSVSEMHVMFRYMRPDLLEDAGMRTFDMWAANFAKTVTTTEQAPTGEFRQKTRFAAFMNVPELLTMFHTFGDVMTADDLNLPTPEVRVNSAGERAPEILAVPRSQAQGEYMADLAERAEAIHQRRVEPSEDNMLKLSGDGRKAAIDMRMVDPEAGANETGKTAVAATILAQTWRETRDNEYLDPATGEVSPHKGALQLVFCDFSTPKNDGSWNAYDDIKQRLIDEGMPAEKIRFIHEAKNDREKADLFADARSGKIAVLIGSTAKMGVGTNVQARAVHLMELDAPWKPADVVQRLGRAIRQGNQNPEVQLTRLVTEGSFDGYMWQTLERKSKFINQVMSGKINVREMEDLGPAEVSYAAAKAIGTGNPLLMAKHDADTERVRLERLHRAWEKGARALRNDALQSHGAATANRTDLPIVREATERSRDTSGDKFAMTIDGHTLRERPAAADALRRAVEYAAGPYGIGGTGSRPLRLSVELGGHKLAFAERASVQGARMLEVSVAGVPRTETNLELSRFKGEGHGIITTLENKITALPTIADRIEAGAVAAEKRAAEAMEQARAPFKYANELIAARQECKAIDAQIEGRTGTLTTDTIPGQGAMPMKPKGYGQDQDTGRGLAD